MSPGSDVTLTMARLLLAPILVVAAAIVVKGYSDVGDGFSAGAVAALGVLLQYLAFGTEETERRLPVRRAHLLALAGLGVALTVAVVPLAFGEPLLTHAPAPGEDVVHIGAVELLTAFAYDVGIALLVFGAVVGIVGALARASEREARER